LEEFHDAVLNFPNFHVALNFGLPLLGIVKSERPDISAAPELIGQKGDNGSNGICLLFGDESKADELSSSPFHNTDFDVVV
jgi:hypothetical protein